MPKTRYVDGMNYNNQNGVIFRIVPRFANSPAIQRVDTRALMVNYQNVNIRSTPLFPKPIIGARPMPLSIVQTQR